MLMSEKCVRERDGQFLVRVHRNRQAGDVSVQGIMMAWVCRCAAVTGGRPYSSRADAADRKVGKAASCASHVFLIKQACAWYSRKIPFMFYIKNQVAKVVPKQQYSFCILDIVTLSVSIVEKRQPHPVARCVLEAWPSG